MMAAATYSVPGRGRSHLNIRAEGRHASHLLRADSSAKDRPHLPGQGSQAKKERGKRGRSPWETNGQPYTQRINGLYMHPPHEFPFRRWNGKKSR